MAIFTPILFGVPNGGFELGDFSPGWAALEAVLDTVTVKSGTYSAKLILSGASLTGPKSDALVVDETRKYTVSAQINIPSYSSGVYVLRAHLFSDLDGIVYLGSKDFAAKTSVTSGWELVEKTIGPEGDLSFFSGTKSMKILQAGHTSPTLTAYLDDVLVTGPALTISPLESYPSERPVQKLQARRMTPGGSADVEDLGPELQFVNLVVKHLSLADKNSLADFIRTTSNWASNYFNFTDDQGTEYENCLFWFDDWNPVQNHNLFDEDILIAVGI